MSTLKLTGSSSGSTSLTAPASGSDRIITFPNNAGTVITNATSGTILQVQQSSTNTATGYIDLSSNTSWYNVTNMTVSITPASASNKILISFMAMGESDNEDHQIRFRLQRAISGGATTAIGGAAASSRPQVMGMIGVGYYQDDQAATPVSFGCSNYLDSPSTTSAITYTVQLNSASNSKKWYYNRSVTDSDSEHYERGLSYITVMEVAG